MLSEELKNRLSKRDEVLTEDDFTTIDKHLKTLSGKELEDELYHFIDHLSSNHLKHDELRNILKEHKVALLKIQDGFAHNKSIKQ